MTLVDVDRLAGNLNGMLEVVFWAELVPVVPDPTQTILKPINLGCQRPQLPTRHNLNRMSAVWLLSAVPILRSV